MTKLCTHVLSTTVAILLLQGLYSCQSEMPSISSAPQVAKHEFFQTRTAEHRGTVAAQAYYYRTLSSYTKGSNTFVDTDADLHDLSNKSINLIVLYDATAPWAELLDTDLPQVTGSETLNALLNYYELQIVKHFTIDRKNKGLVLEPRTQLQNPLEAARLLSMVEHVSLVNIKEVPSFEVMAIDNK